MCHWVIYFNKNKLLYSSAEAEHGHTHEEKSTQGCVGKFVWKYETNRSNKDKEINKAKV